MVLRHGDAAEGRAALARTASSLDVELITTGDHGQPFEVLGPHVVRTAKNPPCVAIRAFLPRARSAAVLHGRLRTPMARIHPAGFFEAVFRDHETLFPYRLAVEWDDGA